MKTCILLNGNEKKYQKLHSNIKYIKIYRILLANHLHNQLIRPMDTHLCFEKKKQQNKIKLLISFISFGFFPFKLPGFVGNPGLIVRGRVIGFPRPQPSSGVSNRPGIVLTTLFPLLNDPISNLRFVGQQIIGSLVGVQMAFDCRI